MQDEAAFDPATLHYYEDTGATYAGSGAGGQNRFLADFMHRLPPGARHALRSAERARRI